MQLTNDQPNAADAGELVKFKAIGKTFILMSQSVYEDLDDVEYSQWTPQERDVIRADTINLLDDDLSEDDDEP